MTDEHKHYERESDTALSDVLRTQLQVCLMYLCGPDRFSLLYGDGFPVKPQRKRLYRSYNKNIRRPSLHHEYLRERERLLENNF